MDVRDLLGLTVSSADAGWDQLVVSTEYCSPSFALEWLRRYRDQKKKLTVITAASSPSSAARFACLADLAARWSGPFGMSAEMRADVRGICSFARSGTDVLSFRYPRPFAKEWWALDASDPSPANLGDVEIVSGPDQPFPVKLVESDSSVPPEGVSVGANGLQTSLALEAQHLTSSANFGTTASTVGRSLRLSLLSQKGEVHGVGGGLNWGLPSKSGRRRSNRDEAYVPVPRAAASSGFFPGHNDPFDVYTDDGRLLIMRVGGGDGFKDLTTPLPNSALGAYVRGRLGLVAGELVTTDHLVGYGRTFLDFTRLAASTYFVDFSVPLGSAAWNYCAPEPDSPLTADGHR